MGEPRSGKTSLLLYLSAPETRKELYGEEGERLLFSFLDAQTFGTNSARPNSGSKLCVLWKRSSARIPSPPTKDDAAAQEKTPPEVLSRLRRNLDEYFNEEELRSLCADLNVDYEDLPAQGKESKIRELVSYLDRRLRIPELVNKCSKLRPKSHMGTPGEVTACAVGPGIQGVQGQ